ncbi:MAG TPA: shikimate dehydrogenase [Ktedonobacterales bacterium]|nr:shikimate dehydrogenase [Ktedonobacterales bacterium]
MSRYQRIGLIGHPVAHSRSPQMQQAALDALGIAAHYELWETPPDALAARIATLREPGYLGANVTIPYKAAVVPLLDEIAPQALDAAGAVNTITRVATLQGVRLIGHNTDILALVHIIKEQGISTSLHAETPTQAGLQLADSDTQKEYLRSGEWRMLVLGAGGAAQAALGAARLCEMTPWVAARRIAEAQATLTRSGALRPTSPGVAVNHHPLAGRALDLRDANALADALRQTRLLINTTPVGMAGTDTEDDTPLPVELLRWLPADALVVDMVYNPPETALVRAARALGRRALGGVAMLLYQGAAAFTLWTGQPAPVAVMRAALLASLGQQAHDEQTT